MAYDKFPFYPYANLSMNKNQRNFCSKLRLIGTTSTKTKEFIASVAIYEYLKAAYYRLHFHHKCMGLRLRKLVRGY